MKPLILTMGHSTRSQKDFIGLLRAHDVQQLVDVRTIPRSRHNPQFNRAVLSRVLRRMRIGYRHMSGLGGLRHARRDSINTGWRNASFRGFADYMQTSDFRIALRQMIAIAKRKRVALMCAEAVPWRCHRSMIADALVIRGFPVEEIQSATRTGPHRLTSWALVRKTRITYPPEAIISKLHAIPAGTEGRPTMIQLKRVYDKATAEDGKRFLVERLWPRGIKKTSLRLDAWLKEVGPSVDLRRWFGHDPKRWEDFRRRYFSELKDHADAWKPILNASLKGRVTLLFSSHDAQHNNAVALKEYLNGKLKRKKTSRNDTQNVAA